MREELGRIATRYDQQFSRTGWSAAVEPLLSEVTGRSRQIIWLLVAAGALVVLVACANIAGLCVARAASRQHELSLRRALGANGWQLIRVGLAENLLMGVAGAIIGLVLAGVGLPLLRQLLPADFPRAHEIGLTWQSAAFASLVSIITALVAGLVASGSAGRLLSQQRVTAGRESRRMRTALVVGEVALAGVLCAGALFLARSFHEIGLRDHGFNPNGVLTFQLALRTAGPPVRGAAARAFDEIRYGHRTHSRRGVGRRDDEPAVERLRRERRLHRGWTHRRFPTAAPSARAFRPRPPVTSRPSALACAADACSIVRATSSTSRSA